MDNEVNPLGLVLVVILVVASIVAWCIFIARRSRSGTPLRYEPRRPIPWGLVDLGLAMVLVIMSSLISGELLIEFGVVQRGQRLEDMSPENAAIMLLTSSVAILAGVVFTLGMIWLKNRPTASDFGLSFRQLGRDVGIGCAGFLLISAPVYAIQYLLVEILKLRSEHPLIELVQRNPDVRFFMVSFVAAVLIAPVAEEILFRVLFQGWLERIPGHRGRTQVLLLGGADVMSDGDQPQSLEADQAETLNSAAPQDRPTDKDAEENPYASPKTVPRKPAAAVTGRPATWPIIVSSLVFALMHSSHGVDPIPLFVLAFGLGFVYRQTHRALPCIIIHMLFNGFSLALLFVEVHNGM